MSENVGLASPWVIFARELTVLFDKDPEIEVVYKEEDDPEVILYVESEEKAEALAEILPPLKTFGNVVLPITVVPANSFDQTKMSIFETAFKGNPAVSYTENVNAFGNELGFIVFKPEVVQYPADDIGDINGIESTLYEEIARDVFEDTENVYFCTDIVDKYI